MLGGLIAFGAKTPLAATLTQQICPCLHKHSLVNYLKEQNNSPEKTALCVWSSFTHLYSQKCAHAFRP